MTTPVAPNREIIVRSFQPGCMRAAAYKGPHAGRTEHAGFLHFGDTAVAPNEVIGKSDPMNQVWPGITVEERSLRFHIANLLEGARRRTERHPPHHDGVGARLLLCGADFAGPTTLATMNFKMPAPRRALCHHCRVRRRPTTLAVAIEHRLTAEILSSTH